MKLGSGQFCPVQDVAVALAVAVVDGQLLHGFKHGAAFDVSTRLKLKQIKKFLRATALAPWFRLHQPSFSPWFESQAHHLRFKKQELVKSIFYEHFI